MTIAQSLHGRRVEILKDVDFKFDPSTLIYTFEDGSRAKVITRMEDCEPYQTASLTTMSKRPYKEWMEVKDDYLKT